MHCADSIAVAEEKLRSLAMLLLGQEYSPLKYSNRLNVHRPPLLEMSLSRSEIKYDDSNRSYGNTHTCATEFKCFSGRRGSRCSFLFEFSMSALCSLIKLRCVINNSFNQKR